MKLNGNMSKNFCADSEESHKVEIAGFEPVWFPVVRFPIIIDFDIMFADEAKRLSDVEVVAEKGAEPLPGGESDSKFEWNFGGDVMGINPGTKISIVAIVAIIEVVIVHVDDVVLLVLVNNI